ncbi:MAG: CRISPR-associated endoribonuclease Cas6 [Nitrospirae bacterium]|nr:CRISPR-associated endoribonuclease Cas6 [Nitrospirota bacterium]
MRVKLTFAPVSRKAVLPINYNYLLTSLIYKIIRNSSRDYSAFLHDEGYKIGESKKGFKLFTFSMLKGGKFRADHSDIVFSGGHIQWEISSPVNDFIQHLVSGVFSQGHEIRIGPANAEVRFLIGQVETLPRPEFKETMKFTCLSPITVSKIIGIPPLTSGLRCHYLRPWEDDFSEAIKNNLVKKCRLVTGEAPEDAEFRIKIDAEYMNKKNGKITKKINFKGTDIIGFMAPFQVTGNAELIEVGYEAGFGGKGSMGFGMVKEIV